MTASPRKREVFANPFFVVLMVASVVFVLTVLAYLISPAVLEPDPAKPPPRRRLAGDGRVGRPQRPLGSGRRIRDHARDRRAGHGHRPLVFAHGPNRNRPREAGHGHQGHRTAKLPSSAPS